MNKSFKQLKQEYQNTPIPKNIDSIIEKAINAKKKKKHFWKWTAMLVPACLLIFIMTISMNHSVAKAMSNVPILKNIVTIITNQAYQDKTKDTEAEIKTPKITGMADKKLEKKLNLAYGKIGEKLIQEYKRYASSGRGHFSVISDYKEVVNTKDLIVVDLMVEETKASSYTEDHYMTLDKHKQSVLRLDDIIKNKEGLTRIQKYIKAQILAETKKDPSKVFLDDSEIKPALSPKNLANRFYINNAHKLVIAFNEYEVAPGYMGTIQFVIPTKVIKSYLTNDKYIQ